MLSQILIKHIKAAAKDHFKAIALQYITGYFLRKLELHNPFPHPFPPFLPLSSLFLSFFTPLGAPHPPNPAMGSAALVGPVRAR